MLTILPLPDWAQMLRPQWYTLVLIYWILALPQRVGVGVGWLTGILVDVITGTLLGQHALALALVAYIAHESHLRVRLFPLWQQSLSVLMLLMIEKVLSFWVMGAVSLPAPTMGYWIPPWWECCSGPGSTSYYVTCDGSSMSGKTATTTTFSDS